MKVGEDKQVEDEYPCFCVCAQQRKVPEITKEVLAEPDSPAVFFRKIMSKTALGSCVNDTKRRPSSLDIIQDGSKTGGEYRLNELEREGNKTKKEVC